MSVESKALKAECTIDMEVEEEVEVTNDVWRSAKGSATEEPIGTARAPAGSATGLLSRARQLEAPRGRSVSNFKDALKSSLIKSSLISLYGLERVVADKPVRTRKSRR
ncbi:hypothetical protein DPMN_034934 [Dreissena polymorpha]|uniref:Uncharacterized protein n=1 Tax=Dreissena polymorpha TaxID=45954 RepID=A0A9D4M9Z2_DREPO|nr:hypothetical protein DPMN_034934 [Dreissena polymorpha]